MGHRDPPLLEKFMASHMKTAEKGPHLADIRLRDLGFRIHSRPRDGRVIWERGGKTYTEKEAQAIAAKERKALIDELESHGR